MEDVLFHLRNSTGSELKQYSTLIHISSKDLEGPGKCACLLQEYINSFIVSLVTVICYFFLYLYTIYCICYIWCYVMLWDFSDYFFSRIMHSNTFGTCIKDWVLLQRVRCMLKFLSYKYLPNQSKLALFTYWFCLYLVLGEADNKIVISNKLIYCFKYLSDNFTYAFSVFYSQF